MSPLRFGIRRLGAIQQYLRNQNMFCILDIRSVIHLSRFFSNPNYAPKAQSIENNVFGILGRGNWTSTVEGINEGLTWVATLGKCSHPSIEAKRTTLEFILDDPVLPGRSADLQFLVRSSAVL